MRHFSTDLLVDVNGDEATLRTNHLAVHVRPDDHFQAGVVHHFEAMRSPVGWRLTQARGHVAWTSGSPTG